MTVERTMNSRGFPLAAALLRGAAVLVAVVAVGLWATPATAQIRGPYLQSGSTDSMTIVWRTLLPSTGRVCFGTSPTELGTVATSGGFGTEHVVRVTGLEPGTRYWYSAGSRCDSTAAGDRYFDTAPEVGSRELVRLWAVGDSGTAQPAQWAVRDAMTAWAGDHQPDLFLHMGDMAYSDGEEFEFDLKFFTVYQPILQNTVCWPTMGNHEGHSADSYAESGPYYDAYVLPRRGESGGLPSGTEAYYAFDYANIHFVVLESHQIDRSSEGAMLTWLREDLAATDQEWIIAYWHHPPYTKGSHDSDGELNLIEMRENANPILESAGVDLVLGGHSHIYERSWLLHGAYATPSTAELGVFDGGDGREDGDGAYRTAGTGTVYIVAGHGGTGVRQGGTHPLMYFVEAENGSCVIDVEGSRLTTSNIRWDRAVSDWFTIDKTDGIFITSPMGGDELLAGSTTPVTWASRGGSATVTLDYSVDGGDVWYRAVEATENDGLFEWSTPGTLSADVWLRLRDDGVLDHESVVGPITLSSVAEIDVVPWTATWEYSDDDTDHGGGWQTTYGGWETGAGHFGYGDGDETTPLLDADPNVPTVYFRHLLDVDGAVETATARVVYDDGFVLWVNGREAGRENVAFVDHGAWAIARSDDNSVAVINIPGAFFGEGENVIAVAVKQRDEDSSDLSFEANIHARVRLDLVSVPPDDPIVGGDRGDVSDTGDDAGPVDAVEVPDTASRDASPTEDSDAAEAATSDVAPDGSGDTEGSGDAGGTSGGADGGCGCRTAPTPGSALWWFGVAALALVRRRGRR